MRPIDKEKRQARRIVAERVRMFFAALKNQLSATEEFWKRIEGRITQKNQDEANR